MDRMMKRMAMVGVLVVFIMLVSGGKYLWGAESPEKFFQGKTIRWIVNSDAGSPTDVMARAIAPYLAKELGAKVRVEDMNVDEALNYVYNQGTRDGLTLVIGATALLMGNDILKAPGVHYEMDKFNFIADACPSTKIFQISPKIPYKSLEALRKAKGLKAGGTSAKGDMAVSGAIMTEILGLDAKVITGYRGKKNLAVALGRGEVDFMVTTDSGAMRDEKDGYIVNLFTCGDKRSVAVPDVPSLSELGVKVPKSLDSAHKFLESGGGYAVALPPGVPQERVEYLRMVFLGLNNNNDLQKTREALIGARIPFAPGKELQQLVSKIKADKELANDLDVIFKKHSAVR